MKNLAVMRIVSLAMLAGMIAGAVAVYVTYRPSGNNDATAGGALACHISDEDRLAIDGAAAGAVAAMLPASRVISLAALPFKAPDGSPTTLADFAGKTILLNLWATWCAPCREEMPALDQLQKSLENTNFEVLAVNIDRGGREKPEAFLKDTGVDGLRHYYDDSMEVFNDLKRRGLALGLPVTVLIDGQGCVLASMNGPADWASEDARQLIDTAMGL